MKIPNLFIKVFIKFIKGFPGGSDGKESTCNAGDQGSIPESGRSPGEGNGYPLQYSFLPEFCGQRSLAGYSLRGRKESNRTDQLTLSLFTFTGLLLFYALFFWPRGIWDLVPYQELNPHSCIGRQSLNHRSAREVPNLKLSLAHVIN